jgi:hypothetical protein
MWGWQIRKKHRREGEQKVLEKEKRAMKVEGVEGERGGGGGGREGRAGGWVGGGERKGEEGQKQGRKRENTNKASLEKTAERSGAGQRGAPEHGKATRRV